MEWDFYKCYNIKGVPVENVVFFQWMDFYPCIVIYLIWHLTYLAVKVFIAPHITYSESVTIKGIFRLKQKRAKTANWILDEDSCQIQKQFAHILNVGQRTISDRSKAMGKTEREEQWLSCELTERQMQNWKITRELLFKRQKWKEFDSNCYWWRLIDLFRESQTQQNPIASAKKQWSVFGGISSRVWTLYHFTDELFVGLDRTVPNIIMIFTKDIIEYFILSLKWLVIQHL